MSERGCQSSRRSCRHHIHPTVRHAIKLAFAAVFAFAFLQVGHAADIDEHVQLKAESAGKIGSLLMIGTSSLNTNRDLGNKQALVGAEVRKLIKARAVEVFPLGIKPDDASPQAAIDQAIAKNQPSHTMSITVPQGTVVVSRLTGEQIAAKDYVVKVEVVDAKTNTLVWEYFGEVKSASNAKVAEAIVARLAKDGLL